MFKRTWFIQLVEQNGILNLSDLGYIRLFIHLNISIYINIYKCKYVYIYI